MRRLLCFFGIHKLFLIGWALDRHGNQHLEAGCTRCHAIRWTRLKAR